jgi:hypothetical protein
MGLDMYASSFAPNPENTDISVQRDSEGNMIAEGKEFHYWRKHHDLHGWMERLYQSKGGTNTFNCEHVRLTLKDLGDLKRAIRLGKLPHTEGFFFGNNPPDEETNKDDLQFIADAEAAIAEGNDVYYSSWW